MKKSIFIIAALLAATVSNAQITLEKTFQNLVLGSDIQALQKCSISSGSSIPMQPDPFPLFLGQYFVDKYSGQSGDRIFDVYDSQTLSLIKTFNTSDMVPLDVNFGDLGFISRGFFTTDNKWAWAYTKNSEFFIVTEDHIELLHINSSGKPYIIKVGEQYKLVVNYNSSTQLYSLPGTGEATDVSEVSTPQKNARKYLHNDQVLIESNEKAYTIQGQEVK